MLEIYPEKQYPEAAEFCKLFLHETTRPRYVLGRNEYAVSIAKCVDIDGFIDDFINETEFLEKPVLKTAEIAKNSLVVSAVVLGRPLIALKNLQNHGVTSCIDYFKFLKYSGLELQEIDLFNLSKVDIRQNWEKYQWIYNRLADEKSKDVLNRLLNFRISGDLYYMNVFSHDPQEQYFDKVIDLKPGEVFVDAGGYDGQTVIEFIKRCPHYKSIHIFEPDPKNLTLARNNLSENSNIYFYMMGLAENKKTLRFSSGGGSASKLCETGDVEIEVDAIDHMIKEPVSLIKMDIEGAEEIALQGARKHILEDHPKLAICCYHKFDDFWKIPEQILAMRKDYLIYLRHYEEGFVETVMYFIPD